MGKKSIVLVMVGVFALVSASYAWDTLRPPKNAAGAVKNQSLGQPNSYLSPNQPSLPAVPNASTGNLPMNEAVTSDASGWPVYPYPDYHNPFYSGNSPRDLFSGTLDWIVALPTTVMDKVSNFLDRKVFPQAPATHGARTPNVNGVQPLYVTPEKPASLPPATLYVRDDIKGR